MNESFRNDLWLILWNVATITRWRFHNKPNARDVHRFISCIFRVTYSMEIETKTYNSLELTLSLSIYGKTAAKKHWSLSKIGFFRRRTTFRSLQCLPRFDPRNFWANARIRLLATHSLKAYSKCALNCL